MFSLSVFFICVWDYPTTAAIPHNHNISQAAINKASEDTPCPEATLFNNAKMCKAHVTKLNIHLPQEKTQQYQKEAKSQPKLCLAE